jgi:1-acyl-sn-glycerol-3-phosphate acyltransferase
MPLLTRLGLPKLWREDPEVAWRFMRWWLAPATMALAPRSAGYGVERVPERGGAVLAINHLSAIDPQLVGAFCPRGIHYMAKAELLALPVVGEILTFTGAYPVRRGEGDREALRRSRELVREGHAIGVFVEGTRQRFGYPGPIHAGALTVALLEGAPVVPCGVESFGWSLRNRRACAVVWGEPLDLSAYRSDRPRDAALVRTELLRLWRQAAEAVAAGLPPQLPDGARRHGRIRPGRRTTGTPPRGFPGPAPNATVRARWHRSTTTRRTPPAR